VRPGTFYLPGSFGDLVSHNPSPPHISAEQRAVADRQLVEACLAAGTDSQGWDAFVRQFSGLVAHVVARTGERLQLSLAEADRDDLVADVFFEVLRNDAAVLKGFAGRSSLAAYLTVIARRVAGKRLRERRRDPRDKGLGATPSVDLLSDQTPTISGSSVDRNQVDRNRIDDRDQVAALLESLDADEAKIVRMFHIEERSYGEISRLLGVPLGSVGPVLSRARAKLRRQAG
jgi:RNA polymerase sigma-70 factor (ECF subfamily)